MGFRYHLFFDNYEKQYYHETYKHNFEHKEMSLSITASGYVTAWQLALMYL